MQMKKYVMTGILFCSAIFIGCADNTKPDHIQQEYTDTSDSPGQAPSFDYEVPLSLPGILVNQSGYLPEGEKIAVFRGENIPEVFEIIEKETGEIVYSGKVEDRGYNEITGENNSYGIFSDFTERGQYYIKAPILGQSYSFAIEEDIYENVFRRSCGKYYVNRCGMTLLEEFAGEAAHNACHTKMAVLSENNGIQMDVSGGWHMDESYKRNIVMAGKAMANLLLAYELYPEAFTDEGGVPESGNGIPDLLDEIKYEADWMLKMQDSASGGVYSETVVSSSGDIYVEPVTLEATAAFAAVMAKFSYIYQSVDTAYATECLRAADGAWRFMEKSREDQEVEQRFFAASELYRATGYSSYRKAAEEYLKEKAYEDMEDNYIFWGCITYLSTKQKVDVELCSNIMKTLMGQAERISENALRSQYLTAGNKEQDNNGRLLHQMMRLTVADHIITNHEYETVIENHLHYFMGRNSKAVSYMDGEGSNNYADIDINLGIMNRFDLNAELIFMMSEVMSSHRD